MAINRISGEIDSEMRLKWGGNEIDNIKSLAQRFVCVKLVHINVRHCLQASGSNGSEGE